MALHTTFERLRRVITDAVPHMASEAVTPEASFADLGCDAVDLTEIEIGIEREFSLPGLWCEIPASAPVREMVTLLDDAIARGECQ